MGAWGLWVSPAAVETGHGALGAWQPPTTGLWVGAGTHSMSAILISSWMRTEGGKSTAGGRRWRELGRLFGAASQELAPQTSTSVHKQVDLGQDVLQGQALQRLQLCDF